MGITPFGLYLHNEAKQRVTGFPWLRKDGFQGNTEEIAIQNAIELTVTIDYHPIAMILMLLTHILVVFPDSDPLCLLVCQRNSEVMKGDDFEEMLIKEFHEDHNEQVNWLIGILRRNELLLLQY